MCARRRGVSFDVRGKTEERTLEGVDTKFTCSLAGLGMLVGFALFVACGGASSTDLFDGVDGSTTSSSSGDSGATSSGGQDSGGVTDSGTSSGGQDGGGNACVPNTPNACPAGSYCEAVACSTTTGTCTKKPTVTAAANPICGCDGVTYFNATLAANASVSTRATGQCVAGAPTTASCGEQKCEGKQVCSLGHASAACNGKASDICWIIPDNCNAADKGTTRTCIGNGGGLQCTSLCNALKNEKDFYVDAQCL